MTSSADAPGHGPLPEPLVEGLHAPLAALGAHGLAEPIGLGGGEPGHVDGQLHELLLEQRDAEGLGQGRLAQGMGVGDVLLAVATPDVGVHRAALDRPGADQGHLDHQVVEHPGLQPGQGGHLGPGLDLEHPHRVGPAEHGVDLGVLGQLGHLQAPTGPGGHRVEGQVEGREHAQAQEVELHQARRRAVVLVPLEDAAVGHAGPLDRAHLDDGPVADDHAAGVDPQVAGGVGDLPGQLDDGGGDVDLGGRAAGGADLALVGRRQPGPAVDLLGPGVLLARRVAQGPGHVPDGGATPVADDVGDLGGVEAAVALVDVLDDLLAPVRLDVDVDVGGTVALRGEEALEEQAQRHRVGRGDAEGEADRRVGGRPPALAVDVLLPAEADDVPDHQEVAGEAEGLDEGELVVDLVPRLGREPSGGPGTVATGSALLDQVAQVVHLGAGPARLVGGAREGRQLGGDEAEVEGQVPGQDHRPLDHAGEAAEAAGLLDGGAQVGTAPRRDPGVVLVEAPTLPHRGQGRGQAAAIGGGVVDVVGGHDLHPGPEGHLHQGVVAGRVDGVAVVPDLDAEVLGAEGGGQLLEATTGHGRPVVDQGGGDDAVGPAGEDDPVPLPRRAPAPDVGQGGQGEPGGALLPGHLSRREGPGQAGVAVRAPGQHHDPPGVVPGTGLVDQAHVRAEDAGDADRGGGLGLADHAVEAVAVGEGEGLEVEAGGLLHQLLGVGGALQEAEVGPAVELGVGRSPTHPAAGPGRAGGQVGRGFVAAALCRPGGAVAAVGGDPPVGAGAGATRQRALDLGPRLGRVVEAHRARDCSERMFVCLGGRGHRRRARGGSPCTPGSQPARPDLSPLPVPRRRAIRQRFAGRGGGIWRWEELGVTPLRHDGTTAPR